jgi:hypothetical protein
VSYQGNCTKVRLTINRVCTHSNKGDSRMAKVTIEKMGDDAGVFEGVNDLADARAKADAAGMLASINGTPCTDETKVLVDYNYVLFTNNVKGGFWA